MSTDPHTLDAVLAHRAALLAQIDALALECKAWKGELNEIGALLGPGLTVADVCVVSLVEDTFARLTAERDAAYARGVEDERRAVVEWLNDEVAYREASAIEAGLHRQGGDRG